MIHYPLILRFRREAGHVKKILIVEDEREAEEALANTLTLWGYEAIAALDGEEALQKVAAEHPDLLILDLVLPKLDGWRVCQRLKTDDRYRKIPIILTSGVLRKESDAAEPMAEVELADAILAKPFHTDHLRALIEKLLPPC